MRRRSLNIGRWRCTLDNYHSIADYFSLFGPRPVAGSEFGSENQRQIFLFAGVVLGAICKVIYDAFTSMTGIEWKALVISLIASIVVFPQLYYAGGLGRRKLSLAHWALAFQNGFFWNVALGALLKKLGAD